MDLIPVSVEERLPFTPAVWAAVDPKPVFWVSPPSAMDMAHIERAAMAAGAAPVPLVKLIDRLRWLVEHSSVAADSKAELAALVEHMHLRTLEDPEDIKRALELEAAAQRGDPVYAGLIADREFFTKALFIAAAERLVRDWEHLPFEGAPNCARAEGKVQPAALAKIPPDVVLAVGAYALSLATPSTSAEKNSSPPSRSSLSRGRSAVGSKPPMGRRGR